MNDYRLVKQIITNSKNNGYVLYNYNDKNMLFTGDEYNAMDKCYRSYRYYNNAMGLPLFRETYNQEKNRVTNDIGYEYDNKGLLLWLNQFDTGRLDALYSYTTFEYDGVKKIKQTIISCGEKKEIEDILYFEYNSNGHKTRTLNKNNETIGTFEYDENGLLKYALFNDSKMEFIWENGISLFRHDMYWFY
jgi:hypothetical protein